MSFLSNATFINGGIFIPVLFLWAAITKTVQVKMKTKKAPGVGLVAGGFVAKIAGSFQGSKISFADSTGYSLYALVGKMACSMLPQNSVQTLTL